ncbi:MAG: ribbon-helix-helix domain-containing protein [Deinococcota bacterium]
MAIMQKKVTVTLPQDLIERLNEAVPSRKRSLFITEAIREHLDLIEQINVLDVSAGSWSLDHHPEMKDEAAIDTWLQGLRQNWG